tara:strand:- start:3082 stop:3657 length:576 start_codon:yes stop_codon:yes gene_type:complete
MDKIRKIVEEIKEKGEFPSALNHAIAGYCDTLTAYAEECDTIVEFGVHQVCSTWALFLGNPKKMDSYDINDCPVEYAKKLSSEYGVEFTFHKKNSLTCDIPFCDLLFIDTDHKYSHLLAELTRHSTKVKKYIILHDTTLFKEQLVDAYRDFLAGLTHPDGFQWAIKEIADPIDSRSGRGGAGLTVLERKEK